MLLFSSVIKTEIKDDLPKYIISKIVIVVIQKYTYNIGVTLSAEEEKYFVS